MGDHFWLKKTLFLVICSFLFIGNIQAQSKLPVFEFVNTYEGFPKRGVTSITTDDQGFLWVGMHGAGLYKYDGINYISYNRESGDTTSINSNVIHAVYKDSQGRLWIGSDGGLNLYNRSLNNFTDIPFDGHHVDRDQQMIVLSIIEHQDGMIYLGTNYNGTFVLDPDTYKINPVEYKGKDEQLGLPHILGFATSSSGEILVGTNLGLKRIDADKGILVDAYIITEEGNITMDLPIQSVLVDDLNNLWIGSQNDGIFKSSCLNSKATSLKYLEHYPVTNRRVMSMVQSREGYIYGGTENDGLYILSREGEVLRELRYDRNEENGIKSNSIWKVFIDDSERLWLGYYDKGIDIYDPNYRKFQTLTNLFPEASILNYTSVTGIVKDENGNLWVATDGSGIFFLDLKERKIKSYLNKIYANTIGAAIQSIFIDSEGNIWAGDWNEGVFFLEKGKDQFLNYNMDNTNGGLVTNRVVTIAEDAKGKMWFGTWGKGIHSYDIKTKKFLHRNDALITDHGLAYYDVRKILVDSNDDLWLGSTKGFYKLSLDENNEVVELIDYKEIWKDQFDIDNSFSNVLSLYKSSDNTFWIGTEGAGLLSYNPELDSVISYNDKNGFLQRTTSAIMEASPGQMWVSGRSGLSHINTSSGVIKNYSEADGLISNDFNYNSVMKDNQGRLYFGNVMGGANYFDPDSIPTNQSDIKVYLTNLRIFNKPVSVGEEKSPLVQTLEVTDEITFDYMQSVFTIEYTGINFTRPEKNQFAYYLDGLEDDWNYVGSNRSATYTSLHSGDYVFKVKAANNDGVWSEEPVELAIKVLPPWWLSNTGFVIYIFLFLLSLYVFYWMMRKRVLERKEIQNERQNRQKEKELNKKKIQFFTNISHEFRTPLTLIVNPLEDIISNEIIDLPDEVNTKHQIIHKNAKRLERLINELMDFRKLSFNKLKVRVQKTEVVSFVHSVSEYFNGEAVDKDIRFQINSSVDEQYAWIDSGLIEKVLFNLLSNAFKVTQSGGKITISIRTQEQVFPEIDTDNNKPSLSITVSDTGPGLSQEHIQHIFDRFYQVENLNKSYYGGTGIGLEVVNNFVKLHKGKIEVKSELDVGTEFTVFLPIEKNYLTDSTKVTQKKSIQNRPNGVVNGSTIKSQSSDSKSVTILIVEDNIELQNYLKTELQKLYHIKTASDGSEGLKVALETLPDLIISDVMMPMIDGFELCKSIKSDVRTCHIPVLMLTAKSNADEQVKGIDLGADAYITKPFNMQLLKSKLQQLLQSRQIIFNKYFNDISETKLSKATSALDKDFVRNMLKIIHQRIGDTKLNVETLSDALFLSRSQLYRKTKALTGMSVNEFIRKIRLEEAKKLIENGNINISEVCYGVGFSSPSYFSKCFKEQFGMLPTQAISQNVRK